MNNQILDRDLYCVIAEHDGGGMFQSCGSIIMEQYTHQATIEQVRERSEKLASLGHRLVCRLVPVELHHLDGSITTLEERPALPNGVFTIPRNNFRQVEADQDYTFNIDGRS